MPENKHIRFLVILAYCALAALGLWIIVKFALPILSPFVIAFIIALIIEKPVRFFSEKLKLPRPLSSGIWTVIAFGGIGTGLYYLCYALFREISSWVKSLPDMKVMFQQFSNAFTTTYAGILDKLPDDFRIAASNWVEKFLSESASLLKGLVPPIGGAAASAIASIPSIFLYVIVVLAATYFFSVDYKNIRCGIRKLIPLRIRKVYTDIKVKSIKTLVSYIRALGIMLCITFVELLIAFSILRFDHVIILAFCIALIDALPIFGVGTVLIPWSIIELCMGNFPLAIALALLYGIAVVVRNLVEPKVVGSQIGLNPLLTLFSIYIGLKFFGFLGIAAPVFVVIGKQTYLSIKEFRANQTQKNPE